jgi:hypothetical protein
MGNKACAVAVSPRKSNTLSTVNIQLIGHGDIQNNCASAGDGTPVVPQYIPILTTYNYTATGRRNQFRRWTA